MPPTILGCQDSGQFLEPRYAFEGVAAGSWSCSDDSNTITCDLAAVAVGPAPTIVVTVTAPNNPTTLVNNANVTSATSDTSAENNSTRKSTAVTAVADLSLNKSVQLSP